MLPSKSRDEKKKDMSSRRKEIAKRVDDNLQKALDLIPQVADLQRRDLELYKRVLQDFLEGRPLEVMCLKYSLSQNNIHNIVRYMARNDRELMCFWNGKRNIAASLVLLQRPHLTGTQEI